MVNRRNALKWAINGILAAITSTLGVILGGSIVPSGLARRRQEWLSVVPLKDLRTGTPTEVGLRVTRVDGYSTMDERQVLYLVKKPDGSVLAMSPTCTHLGCRVSWDPKDKLFKCPCHGGVYNTAGQVVSGPPPKPLTTLQSKVEGGAVWVRV